MNSLRQRLARERFDPGWFGLLINPFFHARRGLARALRPRLAELRGDVLDVGCGQKPYQAWVPGSRYVGVDVDTPTTRSLGVADVFYDGRRLPFPDRSFDAVICSQVFEHVFEPAAFIAELRRVLRPEGRLVLTVPFVWDEHEQPADFGRYTSFGLRSVLERAGFVDVVVTKSVADGRALVQLASGWIFKLTRTTSRPLNLLVQVALIAPVNALGGLVAWCLPSNADFYLDNVASARRPADP